MLKTKVCIDNIKFHNRLMCTSSLLIDLHIHHTISCVTSENINVSCVFALYIGF